MANVATTNAGHATNLSAIYEHQGDKQEGAKEDRKYTFTRNKYTYPPDDYQPPKGTLRVHSDEPLNMRGRGRILQQWSLCTKPRTAPRGGCRKGYFGYFVRSEGVIRKAIWVGTGSAVCDWVEQGVEGGEGGYDGEESGEGLEGV